MKHNHRKRRRHKRDSVYVLWHPTKYYFAGYRRGPVWAIRWDGEPTRATLLLGRAEAEKAARYIKQATGICVRFRALRQERPKKQRTRRNPVTTTTAVAAYVVFIPKLRQFVGQGPMRFEPVDDASRPAICESLETAKLLADLMSVYGHKAEVVIVTQEDIDESEGDS